jgi:hypothetical protein
MKSGVIIYVAGNAPEDWTEDDEAHIRSSEPKADLVEIITQVSHPWNGASSVKLSVIASK